MRFFHRKKKESLSEIQGVPSGTFRCDVCKRVQPVVCLCGTVLDAAGSSSKAYVLCGVCALWLGFEDFRFPQLLCFNFSEEQRERIEGLHKELDMADRELEEIAGISMERSLSGDVEGALDRVHDYLEQTPNLRELLRLRSSVLPETIIDLSRRLTRGECVDPSEIRIANK